MPALLTIAGLGLLLGMRHATDPDHVIAVSTIVSLERSSWRSLWIGAAWGLGHTVTILCVGSAMIVFRVLLPPRVGLAMELAVALMLIVLGVRNLAPLFRDSISPAEFAPAEAPQYHAHKGFIHAHPGIGATAHAHHSGNEPVVAVDRILCRSTLYRAARPFIVGTVHGLAGSAAIALLVLGTIPTTGLGIAYLAIFGLGTVVGMMLITLMMTNTFAIAQRRFSIASRHLGWVTGVISLLFGFFIAYQVGIVGGLFTTQAHWTPR